MRISPAIEREKTPGYRFAVRAGILIGGLLVAGGPAWMLAQAQVQIFGRGGADERELASGVYLPTDRSLSRAMGRAKESLAEKEYHQSLTFLQEVLSRDEDTFLEVSHDATEQQGLKAAARQMISELPPEGRKAYELLNSAAARRRLEAALSAGDQDGVALVVRQYFHTPAGYEAALVLAQMEADHGHHLAAAELYRELIDTPQAAAQFEPQLSALAAANHLAAGQRELAEATLQSLFKRNPAATIELAGRAGAVPGSQTDGVAWLSDLIGKPVRTSHKEGDWLTPRGDPARNARPSGGAPHLRARWEARVVNDPTVEAYLTSRAEQMVQRGAVAIPGARPIAVGDVVLMRTPYNVVAVDWHTGKRIWETREEDELVGDGLPADAADGGEIEDLTVIGNPLEQRVWDDALVTSLASDGERAFVIRSPMAGPQDESAAFQGVPPMFGGVQGSPIANELVAYDLATQGKLQWELDGTRSTGPLAGAFFFGAPLAIDNTLYVMAEIRSAVYLMALEPRTGEVRWQQQLVGLEQGIGLDPARRTVGAMPSYAGGILVCPTSAGAVVAIDVVKREFAWVYRYPREVLSPAQTGQFWPQQQNPAVRMTNRWRENVAIIDDGRVFLTAPESGELYCLELRTGKLLWKKPKTDSLFLACVDQGRVLLVVKNSVRALRVEDGTAVLEQQLPEGAQPSGQGYVSGGRYYLPVTTGGIVTVDVARGEVQAPTAAGQNPILGNLICYRGSVLSQTALVLDKFEQNDVLRERAEAALAKNADDATALRELAEMLRVEGKTIEAVRQLKRAVELAPDDPLAREMLAEVLLEALATDFATYRGDIPLMQRLIRGRDQEIELMRIEAHGLDRLGEKAAAFDAYLRLVDFTAEAPAELQIGPDMRVRSDRWVSGQLANLWSAATPEERAATGEQIEARRPTGDGQPTAAALRHYLAHFGALAGADAARLQLAQWLVERRHAREAEIELLALVASSDEKTHGAAAALLRKLLSRDGTAAETETWPRGAVDARVEMLAITAEERANQRAQRESQPGMRRLSMVQDAWPGFGATQWFVSADGTELVGRNGAGDDIFHLAVDQTNWGQQNRDSGFLHAARLGNLAIVSLGAQIVAIDSRDSERGTSGEMLWQAYPLGRFPIAGARVTSGGGRRGVVYDTWSGRATRGTAPVGGSLGPVTADGVAFQEQNELKCVDPLSGEMLWARADVPAGCELFGDAELLIAADVGKRKAHVFRMLDGQRQGEHALPAFPWMMAAGRNVAQRDIRGSGKDRKMHLRVTDVVAERLLVDLEYDDQAQMSVVEPQALAVYDPSGHFQLVDIRTGQVRIDAQLEPMPDLQNIRTLVSGGQLFLLVNAPSLSKDNEPIAQSDHPLINGYVYAFDMETGEALWPGPAVVRNRGIVLAQPRNIPHLVFVDRKLNRKAMAGGTPQIRILCIDKDTGRTVYRNDELRLSAVNRLRIRAERQATPTVVVEMNGAEVYLAVTDRPRPPQPPANDDLEMPRTSADRGLMEVGRRMVGAVQDALENQPGGNRAGGARNQPEPMDDD